MAEQLKNTLVLNVAPGATQVVAHGLQAANGRLLTPDIVFVPSDGLSVSADDTNVTIVNSTGTTVTGVLLVEFWHTFERAFGGVQNTALVPQPYVVVSPAQSQPPFPTPATVITIYARTTGSDTTGTGTLANPYRTMQRAIRDTTHSPPPGVRYRIDCTDLGVETLPPDFEFPVWDSPHSYELTIANPLDGDPASPGFVYTAGIEIRADLRVTTALPEADTTIPNAGTTLTVLADTGGVDTGLLVVTLAVPRASWGTTDLKGKRITGIYPFFTDGVIYANTNNSLHIAMDTPSLALTQFILSLAPLVIREPSFELHGSNVASNAAMTVTKTNSLAFQGVSFVNTGAGPALQLDGPVAHVLFESCDIAGYYSDGGDHTPFVNCYWNGKDVELDNFNLHDRCLFDTLDSLLIARHGGSYISMHGCVVMDCPTISNGTHPFNPFPGTPPFPGMPNNMVVSASRFINVGTALSPSGSFHWSSGSLQIAFCVIEGCPAAAPVISASRGAAFIDLVAVTGLNPLASRGIEIHDGIQCRVDSLTTLDTVAIDTASMKVGTLDARSWADFRGADPVKNEYDLTTPFATNAASGDDTPAGDEVTGAGSGGRSGSRLFQRT